ncbi:MAG: hypothetical protein MI862_26600 [Desulfobacterales bacterium]|nr:hypothetical protein [Desulfobacterales bacterium]
MDVTTWHNGYGLYGIRIGNLKRDKYFEQTWKRVQIKMDGIDRTFVLTPGFWEKCPEIRDKGEPFIKKWLQKHKTLEWPKGKPPKMKLIKIEGSQFKLVP